MRLRNSPQKRLGSYFGPVKAMSHLYFVDQAEAGIVWLCPEDATHLSRVMRAKVGDVVRLCDGKGTEYEGRVCQLGADFAKAEILSSKKSESEPSVAVTLYLGLPKADKLELVIQKATELGAVRIVPFVSRFCVAKPKNEEKKLTRWNKIAKEAAKQSARGFVPQVEMPLTFEQMLSEAASQNAAFFFYEAGGEALFCEGRLHSRLTGAKTVALITGAEGGFSPEEAQQAKQAGCVIAGLGPRILRCETAPLAALSALMALTGNL